MKSMYGYTQFQPYHRMDCHKSYQLSGLLQCCHSVVMEKY